MLVYTGLFGVWSCGSASAFGIAEVGAYARLADAPARAPSASDYLLLYKRSLFVQSAAL